MGSSLCKVFLVPFWQLSPLWGLKRLSHKSEFVLQFSMVVGSDGLRYIFSSYRKYSKGGLLPSDFLFSPPDYDDNNVLL